ncbi:MAG: hypothetical protein AABZ31_13680 [Bdellovibrionota bacterium]
MSLSLSQTYRASTQALLANIVICLGLMQFMQLEPVWACDGFLEVYPSLSAVSSSDGVIETLKADLNNRKKGYSIIKRPSLTEAEIEDIYKDLPKGWVFVVTGSEISLSYIYAIHGEVNEARALEVYTEKKQLEKNINVKPFAKIQALVDWTKEKVEKSLTSENVYLDTYEIRTAEDNQTLLDNFKLATYPHIDGEYMTVVANLIGDKTFYWDENRIQREAGADTLLFMTNRLRMRHTKIRPTLHMAPADTKKRRLILILRFKRLEI